MEAIRLRLIFDDRNRQILSNCQKSDGLKRSWLLLKPHHQTINDVVSHLLHVFDLCDSCPNGVILSMDGFALPPFESTSIFKDKDLIRVKRKETGRNIAKIDEGAKASEEDEIVEKQPLTSGMKLLANEEFEKETGGYESEEPEEDEDEEEHVHVENAPGRELSSKKRKASHNIQSSTRKRQRHEMPKGVEKSIQKKQIDHDERQTPQKKMKGESVGKKDIVRANKVTEKTETDVVKPTSNFNESHKNGRGAATSSGVPDGEKKVSRSSLRKRRKRQLKREAREKAAKKDAMKELIDAIEIQQADEDSDTQGNIVPITVRPGHIRFAPYAKGKEIQQNQEPKETFQWNGIRNKKKGQKWGKEKQSTSAWNEYKPNNRQYSRPQAPRKEPDSSVDFDKLAPLLDLPKEGDIIAYRLLELSSSWCPELSSFRIGRISSFEAQSNRMILVPVPEYPFEIEKKPDEGTSGKPPDTSLYKEDGSLKIDFPSLVDARIVKRADLNPLEALKTVNEASTTEAGPSNSFSKRINEANKNSSWNSQPNGSSDKETQRPVTENRKKDVWEEIAEALTAKKSQLQEDKWNKRQNSGNRTWSYRTVRGSTIGPTMAMLRARNGI